MEFMIYVKAKSPKGYEMDGFLETYWNLTGKRVKELGGKETVRRRLNNQITKEDLEEYVKEDRVFKDMEIIEHQVVSLSKGKWVPGEYFAHEYDEHVSGKGRKVTYSNGKVEYEIQCTEDDYCVADGMWDEAYGSRVANGCGDHFTPYERGLI